MINFKKKIPFLVPIFGIRETFLDFYNILLCIVFVIIKFAWMNSLWKSRKGLLLHAFHNYFENFIVKKEKIGEKVKKNFLIIFLFFYCFLLFLLFFIYWIFCKDNLIFYFLSNSNFLYQKNKNFKINWHFKIYKQLIKCN